MRIRSLSCGTVAFVRIPVAFMRIRPFPLGLSLVCAAFVRTCGQKNLQYKSCIKKLPHNGNPLYGRCATTRDSSSRCETPNMPSRSGTTARAGSRLEIGAPPIRFNVASRMQATAASDPAAAGKRGNQCRNGDDERCDRQRQCRGIRLAAGRRLRFVRGMIFVRVCGP